MNFSKDLLKRDKKSILRFIFGLIFLFFSVWWITDRFLTEAGIRIFDWVYTGLFFLNGVVHTLEGWGISGERIFGKAFLLVDQDQISVKTSAFGKLQNVQWKNIRSIEYKLNKYLVVQDDGSTRFLELSKIDYGLKIRLREAIEQTAHEKQVLVKAKQEQHV